MATPLPYRGTPDIISAAIDHALASRGIDDWGHMVEQYNSTHPDGGAVEAVTGKVLELCP